MAEVDLLLLGFGYPPDQGISVWTSSGVLPTCGIDWPLNHRQTVPAEEICLAATRIHQQTWPARQHNYQFKSFPMI